MQTTSFRTTLTGSLLAAVTLITAPLAFAHGEVGDDVKELQKHLPAYTESVSTFLEVAEKIVATYETGGAEKSKPDLLIAAWEEAKIHAAIEQNYIPLYAEIWQGIYGIKEGIETVKPITEVRQIQTKLSQTLWQSLGAVKLAAKIQEEQRAGEKPSEKTPAGKAATMEDMKAALDRVIGKSSERDFNEAKKILHQAYEKIFEGMEDNLKTLDAALVTKLEKALNVTLPQQLQNEAPFEEIKQTIQSIKADLDSFKIPTEQSASDQEKPATAKAAPPSGHPFSWPFISWEKMSPRGGTTKGSTVTLDPEANPAFARIHEENLSPKERDRRAILALTGDFRVSFDFIETSSSAHPYQPPAPYFSWATERAFLIEDHPDFISIQHILVMEFVGKDGKISGPHTMKHWRQDWTYQATQTLQYRGENTWEIQQVAHPDNTWTQAVYQVDDSPRYEITGRWDHSGGLSTFTSNATWRPLPRREFSVRSDYNVLGGHHEITVTPHGWLHNQSSRKLLVENRTIKATIATELGANRYERITSPSLDAAATYWQNTSGYWAAVREKWQTVHNDRESFSLKSKVDDKPMFAHLFGQAAKLEDPETDPKTHQDLISQAAPLIDQFLSY